MLINIFIHQIPTFLSFLTSGIRRQKWLAALLSSRWSDCAGRGKCCSDCAAGSPQSCRSPYCGSSGSSWPFWSRMPFTINHKDSHQNQPTETRQACEHGLNDTFTWELMEGIITNTAASSNYVSKPPMGYWMTHWADLVSL